MRAHLKKKPIQVYIEPQQYLMLEVLSRKKGMSKAAIIRYGIDKFLKELPVEEDPALGIMGLGSSRKGDLSEKHDKYIARHAGAKR